MSSTLRHEAGRAVRALALVTGFLAGDVGPGRGQAPGPPVIGPRLPPPTGIYPVGTRLLAPEVGSDADPTVHLPTMVQLWYPADAHTRASEAPYLPDAGLLEAMVASGYYGQSEDVLRSWERVSTHAGLERPIALGRRPYPVLLVSHGLGVSRTQYTSLAVELASHGWIVVTIDHSFGGLAVAPDGGVVTGTGGRSLDEPAGIGAAARRWGREASSVLDRLLAGRGSIGGTPLADRVDPSRVGMIGHSLGGAAAWQACRDDPRIRACAGLDGTPVGEFIELGFGGPTLALQSAPLYSDADLAAAGRTRRRWEEMGAAADSTWRAAAARSASPVHRMAVEGFGHLSYGDAPWVMPNAITRFGGRIVGAGRGLEIVSATLRAFFDLYLSGYPTELLDRPGPRWPELRPDPPG